MATCLHVCLALALKEGREARKAGRQVKSGREARKGSKQACTSGRLGAMKAGCKYGRLVWKAEEFYPKTGVFSAILSPRCSCLPSVVFDLRLGRPGIVFTYNANPEVRKKQQ